MHQVNAAEPGDSDEFAIIMHSLLAIKQLIYKIKELDRIKEYRADKHIFILVSFLIRLVFDIFEETERNCSDLVNIIFMILKESSVLLFSLIGQSFRYSFTFSAYSYTA